MKSLILIAVLILCLDAFGRGSPPPRRSPPAKPVVVEKPIPAEATAASGIILKVDAVGTPANISRIVSLAKIAERIVNSPEFDRRVLNSWYRGKNAFQDTKDTPAQVLAKMKSGAERLSPTPDRVWNLYYKFEEHRNCSNNGWTYPNTKWVWFNIKNCWKDKKVRGPKFEWRKDSGIVGTICHEYTHKLGYDHSSSRALASVPYAVGTICAELYYKYK